MRWAGVLLLLLQGVLVASQGCVSRMLNGDSAVCVCNSTYCDVLPPIVATSAGTFTTYTTSQSGLRLEPTVGNVGNPLPATNVTVTLTLDRNTTYQTIVGFGGGFTDSAGISMGGLDDDARILLMNSYFSENGLEYNMGRVPIAGCDFSIRAYSYDDNSPGDLNLTNFTLQYEDYTYKIPMIQQAMAVSTSPVNLYGSSWSPPPWMKTNDNYSGEGYLKGDVGGEYYDAYALYHVKFLQAYQDNGINIWGLTTGNEPYAATCAFNCLRMTWDEFTVYIPNNLGPALDEAGFGDVQIMMLDDNRNVLVEGTSTVLSNADAASYVDGIALHWYADINFNASSMRETHESFPDHFMLYTEACYAWYYHNLSYVVGQWAAAEYYAQDIIAALRNWAVGWVDWNLSLDMSGGPTYAGDIVDSPVRVNSTAGEFYKQPSFYAMGHFSKFIPRGSVHFNVEMDAEKSTIQYVGLTRPDGGTVVIMFNTHLHDVGVTIADDIAGDINTVVPANGIQTVIWWT